MQKLVGQINALSPYDPAAALWVLRATAYRHSTALKPDVARVQGAITEWVDALQRNWFELAGRLRNDADALQVCVTCRVRRCSSSKMHCALCTVGGVKAHEVFLIVTHAPSPDLRGC
jgi:hypothetical protein